MVFFSVFFFFNFMYLFCWDFLIVLTNWIQAKAAEIQIINLVRSAICFSSLHKHRKFLTYFAELPFQREVVFRT